MEPSADGRRGVLSGVSSIASAPSFCPCTQSFACPSPHSPTDDDAARPPHPAAVSRRRRRRRRVAGFRTTRLGVVGRHPSLDHTRRPSARPPRFRRNRSPDNKGPRAAGSAIGHLPPTPHANHHRPPSAPWSGLEFRVLGYCSRLRLGLFRLRMGLSGSEVRVGALDLFMYLLNTHSVQHMGTNIQ